MGISEGDGYFLFVTLLLLLSSTFLLVVKGVSKNKIPPWHGIGLGPFALVAIALPLNHSDIVIFLRDKSDWIDINTSIFLGKMCSDRRKNYFCGQKKPEGTSSATFNVGTAAKYCEFNSIRCYAS